MRLCIMPGLPTHLVQELNVGTVCVQRVIWTPRSLFFDSLDTKRFRSGFADVDNSRINCMKCHSYNTKKAVTGLKKQKMFIYMVNFTSSANSVPHFGHPKVYETFVRTPCFQILAKTGIFCHFSFLLYLFQFSVWLTFVPISIPARLFLNCNRRFLQLKDEIHIDCILIYKIVLDVLFCR